MTLGSSSSDEEDRGLFDYRRAGGQQSIMYTMYSCVGPTRLSIRWWWRTCVDQISAGGLRPTHPRREQLRPVGSRVHALLQACVLSRTGAFLPVFSFASSSSNPRRNARNRHLFAIFSPPRSPIGHRGLAPGENSIIKPPTRG